MEGTLYNFEWSVKTTRNSPSVGVTTNSQTRDCRVIQQIISAPDGSKICLEQHISNTDDFHDVMITKV